MTNPVTRNLSHSISLSDPTNDSEIYSIDERYNTNDINNIDGLIFNFDFSNLSSMTIEDGTIDSIIDIKGRLVASSQSAVTRPKFAYFGNRPSALFDDKILNGTTTQRLLATSITLTPYRVPYGDWFVVAAPYTGAWLTHFQNSNGQIFIALGGYPSLSVRNSTVQMNGSTFVNDAMNLPLTSPRILGNNDLNVPPICKAFSWGFTGEKYRGCIDDRCFDLVPWLGSTLTTQTHWFHNLISGIDRLYIGNSSALNNGVTGYIMQLMYVADPNMTDEKRISICRALSGKWGLQYQPVVGYTD